MKRLIAIILLVLILCGCGNQNTADETTVSDKGITLWVVTESTDRYGMNDQAQKLATQFEKTYKNVSVRLDVLPESGEEREVYLDQLRTQIMAGKGPDIYLLPVTSYRSTEQLFQDVNQCMYNGIFCDISEFYESDMELNTEGLVTAVMDAGTIGDARYVLPLRYDLPVAYVNDTAWSETGMDSDLFASGITALWQAALDAADAKLAYGAFGSTYSYDLLYYAMNLFPTVIDYENQEVLLTAENVTQLVSVFQDVRALCGEGTDYFTSYYSDYCWGRSWMELGYSVYVGSLSDAMEQAAIARKLDVALSMYPVTGSDGTVVADVTYYGAVGSSCDCPELAYEYLRLFLTEEAQWEDVRRDTSGQSYQGLIAKGWPARAVGGTTKLWTIIKSQYTGYVYEDAVAESRRKGMQKIWLTDEDLPILYTQIDAARFSLEAESELAVSMLSDLNDSENGYAATDTDLSALADDIIQKLWWHVAEG